MSSASPFGRSHPDSGSRPGAKHLEALLVGSVRRAGFWSAVVIPFVLLGLVVTGTVAEHASLFAALVAANVLGLRLGRDHKRT